MSLNLPAPSADVPPATSSDLKLFPFVSTFHDPAINIPRHLPTFPFSTFIDFTPPSFCFLDLYISPIPLIHFSTMINPLGGPPMHPSMFIDIARPRSAFRFPP
jgi:hypothetical protein